MKSIRLKLLLVMTGAMITILSNDLLAQSCPRFWRTHLDAMNLCEEMFERAEDLTGVEPELLPLLELNPGVYACEFDPKAFLTAIKRSDFECPGGSHLYTHFALRAWFGCAATYTTSDGTEFEDILDDVIDCPFGFTNHPDMDEFCVSNADLDPSGNFISPRDMCKVTGGRMYRYMTGYRGDRFGEAMVCCQLPLNTKIPLKKTKK